MQGSLAVYKRRHLLPRQGCLLNNQVYPVKLVV